MSANHPFADVRFIIQANRMNWSVILAASLLVGCSPVTHTFEVETKDAHSPVNSAVVSICDKPEQALERSGTRFSVTLTNRCEGSGYVRLSHAAGAITDCPVGYVTTLDERWSFVVRDRSCDLQEMKV